MAVAKRKRLAASRRLADAQTGFPQTDEPCRNRRRYHNCWWGWAIPVPSMPIPVITPASGWRTNWLVQHGGQFRPDTKYHGETCRIALAGQDLWLLKPMTFGEPQRAVGRGAGALSSEFPPPAILVAHDDLDLPLGTVRLKQAGGHGGHNGLRDLIAHLG